MGGRGKRIWVIDAKNVMNEASMSERLVPNRETRNPINSEQMAIVKALMDMRLPTKVLE